jgi:hypothetical protein
MCMAALAPGSLGALPPASWPRALLLECARPGPRQPSTAAYRALLPEACQYWRLTELVGTRLAELKRARGAAKTSFGCRDTNASWLLSLRLQVANAAGEQVKQKSKLQESAVRRAAMISCRGESSHIRVLPATKCVVAPHHAHHRKAPLGWRLTKSFKASNTLHATFPYSSLCHDVQLVVPTLLLLARTPTPKSQQ